MRTPIAIFTMSMSFFVSAAMGFGESLSDAIGPAPSGEPKLIAMKTIRSNFDPPVCRKVESAFRWKDGSIRAKCGDGETFMVFTFHNKAVAMRCSVAEAMGISGCS